MILLTLTTDLISKNLEQRMLEIFSFNNINSFLNELVILGFNYSFQYPEVLNLELIKGMFYLKHLFKLRTLLNTKFLFRYYTVDNIYTINNNKFFIHFKNLTNNIYSKINPISTSLNYIIKIGARSNKIQLDQLINVRGIISNIRNYNSKIPILQNFTNGLNILEYIISSYGSRKGILDTAIKTSSTGYLTRRIIENIQDIIIKELDCNTLNTLKFSYYTTIQGHIINFINLNYKNYKKINSIYYIYNPIICMSGRSFCNKCIGYLYNINSIPNLSLGILAGESIGEPSTQLTLRTFHMGGVINTKFNKYILKYLYTKVNNYKLLGYIYNIKYKYYNNKKLCINLITGIKKNKILQFKNILKFKKFKLDLNYKIYNSYIYMVRNINYFYISSLNKKYKLLNFIKIIKFNLNIFNNSLNCIQLLFKNTQNEWILKLLVDSIAINYKSQLLFIKTIVLYKICILYKLYTYQTYIILF